MEEKDVNSIASAVTAALAKLNADTAASEAKEANDAKSEEVFKFKCPDCGGEVTGGIKYCNHCACELEWEA